MYVCDNYGKFNNTFQYTQKKAMELNLKGNVMNTDHKTVTGVLEGELSKINEM